MRLSDVEFAVHLLDGRVISVHVSPSALVSHVIGAVKQQLYLPDSHGWALYEVRRPTIFRRLVQEATYLIIGVF